MNSILSTSDKEQIRAYALSLGACACGFAHAQPVEDEALMHYNHWLESSGNASMDYCSKYMEQRADPRLLLEGAKTIISCAFAYPAPRNNALIASYSLGYDYHYIIKQKLIQLGKWISSLYGGEFRACVDTAPIMERYWAVKSGIGFIGRNSQLIVEGVGSHVFLGELLLDLPLFEADRPCTKNCNGCNICLTACPNHAIGSSGQIMAIQCQSYLTIEHRGELPPNTHLKGYAYGCDLCQLHCPHNRNDAPVLPELQERPEIAEKSLEEWLAISSSQYKKLTAQSAMRRVPYKQFIRNISALISREP